MRGILVLTMILGLIGCETAGKKTAIGSGVGAAVGAGVGAVIGHQSGNRGKGALIGGLLGAGIGGAVGYRLDKQAKELAAIAETRRTEQGIITKLKGDILFSSGSTALKGAAGGSIDQIADIVKKYPEDRLTIIGHTDSQGSDSLNQNLSEKRASTVAQRLIARGVPAQTVSTAGLGETSPIADNGTASGRSLNRRVEIQIRMEEQKK